MCRGVVLLLASLALLALTGCASTPSDQQDLTSSFTGTSQLSFRLRRIIEDSLIEFARDPSTEAPLFDAALDLQDHFLTIGYPDARVRYELRSQAPLRVVFHVDEGPMVTVKDLTLTGNASIATSELLSLWSRTRSGLLGFGDPYFVKGDLEVLRSTIAEYYNLRGFLDVKITGPVIDRSPTDTEATVHYVVDEGTRYRLEHVTIAPELPIDADRLLIHELLDKPLSRIDMDTLRVRARTLLQEDGYPEPRVDLFLDVDRTAALVTAQLRGDPGARSHIRSVTISGQERSREFVIGRHVRIVPNTLYKGSAVEETVRRLYGTGLFTHVEVVRTPRDPSGTEVDMEIKVREVDSRDIDFLAGYGSYETLRGGVSFTDRNLFGLGQRFQIGTRASLKGYGLSTTWTEPHLLSSDTSLTIGGNLREREEPTFVDVTRGVDVAFARDLFRDLRGRVGYSLQSRDGRQIDSSIPVTTDVSFEIGTVFGELVYDRRDSPLFPTRGYRLAVKMERADEYFGGSVNLDRLTWSGSTYYAFSEDWVLGLSGRSGVIWPKDENGIPLQERFFSGGESSVRSFRQSRLGPLSLTGIPTGGAWFNTFNAELRMPLVRALHGAVFVDLGNVGTNPSTFGLADLRYAVGAGLRLILPIGPVRLDAAANPDRRPGEDSYVLHFSVGWPF